MFYLIAATDEASGLGKDGLIPWRFPEDFKWFKGRTKGATCYMGRITYEELAKLAGKKKEILPGRKCVVFSEKPINDPRVTWCNDITKYRDYATNSNFFIGGRGIFTFALSVVNVAYITQIPGDYDCDVKFPMELLEEKFEMVGSLALGKERRLKMNAWVRKYDVS
jgi:dihydrofolate reductase